MEVHPEAFPSVLVVEDDSALRTLLTALLNRDGYRVDCVGDGSEALDQLASGSYEVMLVDVVPLHAGGSHVLRHMRETMPALLKQTIVTTGLTERELARIDCRNVFAVLRKPFDIDELMAKVNDCARQRTPHRHKHARRTIHTSNDDVEHSPLEEKLCRFETALPELRTLMAAMPDSNGELMLRGEMRRVALELSDTLAAAAAGHHDAKTAWRYALLSRGAQELADGRERNKRGH